MQVIFRTEHDFLGERKIAVLEKKLITQAKWDEIYSIDNLINPKFINK